MGGVEDAEVAEFVAGEEEGFGGGGVEGEGVDALGGDFDSLGLLGRESRTWGIVRILTVWFETIV